MARDFAHLSDFAKIKDGMWLPFGFFFVNL